MARIVSRAGVVFLVITLLIGLVPTTSIAGSMQWDKIDPALQALMTSNARGTWPIIVEGAQPSVKASHKHSNAERSERASERLKANKAKPATKLSIIGGVTSTGDYDTIAALSRDPFVGYIHYDAPVRPLDGPNIASIYTQVVDAPQVWSEGHYTGKGVGVAVLDSGINPSVDLTLPTNRLVARVDLVGDGAAGNDPGGHGTHVAGIIAGNGYSSLNNATGPYVGVAIAANLIDVRVINATGSTNISTVIKGVQWVVQNRQAYNIRVINVSLGASVPGSYSYHNDPLVAALNVAWLSGIVVVSAAGNAGPGAGTISTPGTDPMLITVGALDDAGTQSYYDDSIPVFSSRGPTPDGFNKPDLVAPGRRIVSLRSPGSYLDTLLSDRVVTTSSGATYFRLSGTSMASPVVAGVVALMLEKNPNLKPDQVKYILTHTTRTLYGYDANTVGAGLVQADSAVGSSDSLRANRNKRPADAFARAVLPLIKGQPLAWRDMGYAGRNWANVTWDNVTWDNVTWDNLLWDNIAWDNVTWDNLTWDNITWDNITWDNVAWDAKSALLNIVGSLWSSSTLD